MLGFAIDIDSIPRVLLIKKNHPEWQKGRLNGIGGHIEAKDGSPVAAMVREFQEETGIQTKEIHWTHFANMRGPGWDCACFRTFGIVIDNAETKTDEEISIHSVNRLHKESVISNVSWLVQMAMDISDVSSDNKFVAEILYT